MAKLRGRCQSHLSILEEVQRIIFHAIDAHLEVDVDARGAVHAAGVAHPGDGLTLFHILPLGDIEFFVMAVKRLHPVAVVDDDVVAISAIPAVISLDDFA